MNKENKEYNQNLNRLLKKLSWHEVNVVHKTTNKQSSFNINKKLSFIPDSDSDSDSEYLTPRNSLNSDSDSEYLTPRNLLNIDSDSDSDSKSKGFLSCRSSCGLDSELLTITIFYLTKLDEIVNNISLDENYSKDIDEINIKNDKKRRTFFYHIFKIFPFYKKKYSNKVFSLILYFKLDPSMGDLLISYLNLCTDIFNDPDPNNWKSSLCFDELFVSEEDLGAIRVIDKKIKNIRAKYNDKGLDILNKEDRYSTKKNFNVTNDLLFPLSYKKQESLIEEQKILTEKDKLEDSPISEASNQYLFTSNSKEFDQKGQNSTYNEMQKELDTNLILVKKLKVRIGNIVLDTKYYDLYRKNKKGNFFHSIARFFGRKKNGDPSLTFEPEKYYTVTCDPKEAERNLILITSYMNIIIYELSIFGKNYTSLNSKHHISPEVLSKPNPIVKKIKTEMFEIFDNAMKRELHQYLNKDQLKKVSFFSHSDVNVWNQISTDITKEI